MFYRIAIKQVFIDHLKVEVYQHIANIRLQLSDKILLRFRVRSLKNVLYHRIYLVKQCRTYVIQFDGIALECISDIFRLEKRMGALTGRK